MGIEHMTYHTVAFRDYNGWADLASFFNFTFDATAIDIWTLMIQLKSIEHDCWALLAAITKWNFNWSLWGVLYLRQVRLLDYNKI